MQIMAPTLSNESVHVRGRGRATGIANEGRNKTIIISRANPEYETCLFAWGTANSEVFIQHILVSRWVTLRRCCAVQQKRGAGERGWLLLSQKNEETRGPAKVSGHVNTAEDADEIWLPGLCFRLWCWLSHSVHQDLFLLQLWLDILWNTRRLRSTNASPAYPCTVFEARLCCSFCSRGHCGAKTRHNLGAKTNRFYPWPQNGNLPGRGCPIKQGVSHLYKPKSVILVSLLLNEICPDLQNPHGPRKKKQGILNECNIPYAAMFF